MDSALQNIIHLLSTPWLGSVLGVLGLVVAIYFYLKSRRIARIAFQLDEIAIVGGGNAEFPNEMEIRFAGAPVDQVTATKIVFWNAGNETIRRDQVVTSDPIRFELEGAGTILKFDILQTTRKANDVQVKRSNEGQRQFVEMSFDYLDPRDGFILEIFHSGTKGTVECRGTVRGVPKGISKLGRSNLLSEPPSSRRRVRLIVPMIGASLSGLMMLAGLLQPFWHQWFPNDTPKEPMDPTQPSWALVILGALYFFPSLIMFWTQRRRYPASLDFTPSPESKEQK